MSNKLMSGLWRYVISVPPALWQRQIMAKKVKAEANMAFMSPEHRLVHHHVVRELPRLERPLPPEQVAADLDLDLERVRAILDDLEKHLTFLFRNPAGAVLWAYPITVERTPHQVTFSSRERLYAAWAIDSFATPFVQGRLRQEKLSISLETQCAHCGRPMHLEIDSEMNYATEDHGCQPIVFVPRVDLSKLKEPSIIDGFWKESVFFWSEEHARQFRRQEHRKPGAYFTAAQVAYVNRIIQSVLFGF